MDGISLRSELVVTGAGGWRREAGYLIELVGVTVVTVAQPVFNVVQQAPEELVSLGARSAEIIAYALLLVLGPPLGLWLLEQPFRLLGRTVRDGVHAGILGLGVGLFAIELVKSALFDAQGRSWLIGVGLLVAVAATWFLLRSEKARSALRYLALAAPAFLGLFLLASPVSDLVVADGVDPADVDVGNPVPVVLVAFDEFPEVSLLDGDGHIDADTYPAFADLAGDSTWFRNNTGVSPLTPSALPAILTGQLPDELFPAPVAAKFDQSVFTLLGGTYDVDAVETLTALCPPGICAERARPSSPRVVRSLLDQAVTVFRGVAEPWVDQPTVGFVVDRDPSDPEAPSRLRAFARESVPGARPTLDVGHFLLPHQPWDWLASGRTYEAPDPPRSAEFGGWFDQTTADAGRQRHLVQLRYTDTLLGQALADLRANGIYDDALVIVTADHGIGFAGGEPLRAISEANHAQVMWTPLFVKLPGQAESAVDDRPTETIDVVPTIADVLDVDIPWSVDGVSVFDDEVDRTDRPARMIWWRFDTVEANEDDYVVFDRAEGFAEVLAGTTPMAGQGDDPYAVLRLGQYGDLVGTRVADAGVGPPVDFAVTTYSRPTFTVAEGATDLPAYVEGIWAEDPEPWIAVSVDGTVAGIARTYRQGQFATFWSLLAEDLLTPGEHDLEFLAVSGPPEAPRLAPIEMVPRQD